MSATSDRAVVRDLLVGGGRQTLALLVGLVTLPVLTRLLDRQQFGAWSLIAGASVMLSVADLGLSVAVQRAAVTQDSGLARRMVRLSLSAQAVLLPVLGIAAYLWLRHISAEHMSPHEISAAAILALAGGSMSALLIPYRMFAFARGGGSRVADARMLASASYVVLLLGGSRFYPGLLAPAVALLGQSLVELSLVVRAARKLDPQLPILPGLARDRSETSRALSDGAAALVINVMAVMALRIDLFILSAFISLELVGVYNIIARTVEMAYLLPKQAVATLMPSLGNPSERVRAVRIGTMVLGGIVCSGMPAIALTGQPALVLWLGDKADGQTPAVLLLLLSAVYMVISLAEVPGSMVMLGARTGWACATPIAVGMLVHFGIALAGVSRYGVVAVAGGMGVGCVVACALLWRNAAHLLQEDLPEAAAGLASPLVSGAVAVAVALLLEPLSKHGPLQSLVSSVVTTGAGLSVIAAHWWLTRRRRVDASVAPSA